MEPDSRDILNNLYRTAHPDDIPWNFQEPPDVLKHLFRKHLSLGCSVLELGCGLGHYVHYLADLGYAASGFDYSEAAIEIARETARGKRLDCRFFRADITDVLPASFGPYDVIYDWEFLHHIYPEQRGACCRNVQSLLDRDGTYFSVCFSEEDSSFGGSGKFRKSSLGTTLYFSNENELRTLFSRFFTVLDIRTIDVPGKKDTHRAVAAVMRVDSR